MCRVKVVGPNQYMHYRAENLDWFVGLIGVQGPQQEFWSSRRLFVVSLRLTLYEVQGSGPSRDFLSGWFQAWIYCQTSKDKKRVNFTLTEAHIKQSKGDNTLLQLTISNKDLMVCSVERPNGDQRTVIASCNLGARPGTTYIPWRIAPFVLFYKNQAINIQWSARFTCVTIWPREKQTGS